MIISCRAKTFASFLATGLLATFLAACGDGETLTIYSGRSQSLVDPIIRQFSDQSGIKVAVNYASTPQLAATLLEEGGNTPADVFFAQDPGGLSAVQHLLSQLPERILDQVPQWARAPDGKWVGFSGRARAVVFNTETLAESELPDDIFDFINPRWRGRIGWAPANASFQTMVTAMRVLWGEEKALQWLEGIQANDPKMYPKNTPIVAAVAAGEIDVGFVNHYYLYRFLKEEGESFRARNYHPRSGGPGVLIIVAGAGVLEHSRNRGAAELFLEFMLSPPGQLFFAEETFEYPLIQGVATHPRVKPLEEIDNPDLPSEELTDLKGTQDLLRKAGVVP